jgi:hypothetical protein
MKCRPLEKVPVLEKDEWVSVLKLSHKWGFHAFHDVAVRKLESNLASVDMVVLGRAYNARAWLRPGYTDICTRADWLSDADCRRVGLEDLIKIGRTRERIRGETMSDAARGALIDEAFQLRDALPKTENAGHEDTSEPTDAPLCSASNSDIGAETPELLDKGKGATH